jgi:hypothetical protein
MGELLANSPVPDPRLDELLAECLCRAHDRAAALARGAESPVSGARLEELIGLLTGTSTKQQMGREAVN